MKPYSFEDNLKQLLSDGLEYTPEMMFNSYSEEDVGKLLLSILDLYKDCNGCIEDELLETTRKVLEEREYV